MGVNSGTGQMHEEHGRLHWRGASFPEANFHLLLQDGTYPESSVTAVEVHPGQAMIELGPSEGFVAHFLWVVVSK